jgi:hypothetical protein
VELVLSSDLRWSLLGTEEHRLFRNIQQKEGLHVKFTCNTYWPIRFDLEAQFNI